MGWFTKMFTSGPEAATTALKAGIAGIDMLVLTDEERVKYQKDLADTWNQTQKAIQEETSIRSVTRRILAFMVMGAFVALVLGAALSYKFDEKYAAFLLSLAEGQFGWLVMGVATFYFGPMLGRVFGGEKK